MKYFLLISFLVLSLGLAACTDNNFPVYSHLDSLRVMALIADKPEVAPGTTVNIIPYVSDATGAGRALTYSAAACMDPGIGVGASPTCVGSATLVTIATAQAIPAIPATSSYTGAAPSFTVTVPAVALTALPPVSLYNGVAFLITYNITASDGTAVSSFKRIIVSQGHPFNNNPTITDLTVSGATIAAAPKTAQILTPVIPTGAAETYTLEDSTGAVQNMTEDLLVTWFSNGGDFDFVRTDGNSTNNYTPGSAPPSGHVTFAVVVRDGRGGEAIIQKNF